MPNLIVGLGVVMVLAGMVVMPARAVLDCLSEYNGYCTMCKEGFALREASGYLYGCDGGKGNYGEGSNGVDCILICHKSIVCVESSYMLKEGTRRYSYSRNISLGQLSCMMPSDCLSGASQETTSIDNFCKNLSHDECVAGYYGDPNNGGCKACGNSGTAGLYTNTALTATADGQSYGGTSSSQTSCYIKSGTYYDKAGTVTISSSCYYKS